MKFLNGLKFLLAVYPGDVQGVQNKFPHILDRFKAILMGLYFKLSKFYPRLNGSNVLGILIKKNYRRIRSQRSNRV